MNKKVSGSFSLAFATVIWGSTFVAQSVGMDYVGPFTFQAVRCMLAVLVLLPVIALFDRKEQKDFWKKWLDKRLWLAGITCGTALFAAANLQQVGMVSTTAGKAGFLTAMYIVLVPLRGIISETQTRDHGDCECADCGCRIISAQLRQCFPNQHRRYIAPWLSVCLCHSDNTGRFLCQAGG